MGFVKLFIPVAIIAGLAVYWNSPTPKPIINEHQYWGPSSGSKKAQSNEIKPFSVDFPNELIDNLRKKLSEPITLAEPLENVGFRYGFQKNALLEWIEYWRDNYLPRWAERQQYLNQFPQYTTQIQGLKIHYIHARDQASKAKNIVPLLVLHGWPGSVREFYEMIPKLIKTNDDTAFVVIAPSLPGYGWSDGASVTGLNPSKVAVVMRNLMIKLGFKRFVIQGGDWGSSIGSSIAAQFPENVIAYHSNMCIGTSMAPLGALKGFIASFYPSYFIPAEHVDFVFPLKDKFSTIMEETGYFHLQATKPDTIGAALSNNPIGLAAYILEKFSTWANLDNRERNDGGLYNHFSKDALLDNIMIYYLSNSITTSMRLYAESMTAENRNSKVDQMPTDVPAGCARFKHDLKHDLDWQLTPKYTNLIHSTYYGNGGHFPALELPDVLYKDFSHFIQKVKTLGKFK